LLERLNYNIEELGYKRAIANGLASRKNYQWSGNFKRSFQNTRWRSRLKERKIKNDCEDEFNEKFKNIVLIVTNY